MKPDFEMALYQFGEGMQKLGYNPKVSISKGIATIELDQKYIDTLKSLSEIDDVHSDLIKTAYDKKQS